MERYFTELADAFVRGRLNNAEATLADGLAAGLRLHKFKQDAAPLVRVQRVLGILRGLAPETLLDVGSGRGAFLWPLLNAFPHLAVTCMDVQAQRVDDIDAVRRGGIARLRAVQMNAEHMAFAPRSFDVVTLLEVLEHMTNPGAALAAAVATARRFVVLSVPSVPDDNPEHLHLFAPMDIERMARAAGGGRVSIEHVLNHRIAVIRVPQP